MDQKTLGQTFAGLDIPFLGPKSSGKVRDIYERDSQLILITTDRLSAFDHILGLVPFKGQALNQLAASGSSRREISSAITSLSRPIPM